MEVKVKVPADDVDWKRFLDKAVELKRFELELERSRSLQRVVLEMLASKSRLSEEQAKSLSKLVNKGLAKRYK
ncbi:MAG: hypothetical protein HY514_02155 [Candidatus Aenigmarchaeota archaeon]|nr:hypothetical protein [Candidatus Aenigmarchaeota archaeon]